MNDRVPINIKPEVREALRNLLAVHPRFRASGVGYSDFIQRAITRELEIDKERLNDAKWAACNRSYPIDGNPPSMEWCSQLAEDVVRTYLGITPEDWKELNA